VKRKSLNLGLKGLRVPYMFISRFSVPDTDTELLITDLDPCIKNLEFWISLLPKTINDEKNRNFVFILEHKQVKTSSLKFLLCEIKKNLIT